MKVSRRVSLLLATIATLMTTGAVTPPVVAGPPTESPPQPVLRYGNRSATVSSLQQQLRAAGFDPGPIDGIFGPRTLAAVRAAQQGYGLQVDGLAGPLTRARLQVAAAESPAQTAERSASGSDSAPTPSQSLTPVASGKGLDLYAAATDNVPAVPASASPAVPASAPAAPAGSPQLFALTFNSDPDPELLPGMLATLKRHGMQATFFLHGEYAERNPEVVAGISADGHEIASAGYAAQDLTALGEVAASAQLRRANQALKKAAGHTPAFFRPPDGKFNGSLLQAMQKENLKLVLWSNVGQMDWPGVDPQKLAQGLARSVSPGAIIMLHENRPAAAQALDKLLGTLRAGGYQSVVLSSLMAP